MQQQPQPEPQQKPQRAQQYRAVLEYDAGRTAMVLLSTGSQGLQLDFEPSTADSPWLIHTHSARHAALEAGTHYSVLQLDGARVTRAAGKRQGGSGSGSGGDSAADSLRLRMPAAQHALLTFASQLLLAPQAQHQPQTQPPHYPSVPQPNLGTTPATQFQNLRSDELRRLQWQLSQSAAYLQSITSAGPTPAPSAAFAQANGSFYPQAAGAAAGQLANMWSFMEAPPLSLLQTEVLMLHNELTHLSQRVSRMNALLYAMSYQHSRIPNYAMQPPMPPPATLWSPYGPAASAAAAASQSMPTSHQQQNSQQHQQPQPQSMSASSRPESPSPASPASGSMLSSPPSSPPPPTATSMTESESLSATSQSVPTTATSTPLTPSGNTSTSNVNHSGTMLGPRAEAPASVGNRQSIGSAGNVGAPTSAASPAASARQELSGSAGHSAPTAAPVPQARALEPEKQLLFYHDINRLDAEQLLMKSPAGSFLLRPSSEKCAGDVRQISLSYTGTARDKTKKLSHARILVTASGFTAEGVTKKTFEELRSHFRQHCLDQQLPDFLFQHPLLRKD